MDGRRMRGRYGRRTVMRGAVVAAITGTAGVALAACGGEGASPTALAAPTAPPATGASSSTVGASVPTSGANPMATTVRPTVVSSTPTVGTAATVVPSVATNAPPTSVPAGGTAAVGTMTAEGRIPAPAPGVPDAYLKPPPTFKSVAMTPGRGGRVTTLQNISVPPPPPKAQNRYWQELEKRLGVTFDATLVPGQNYTERLAAVTAGGDFPDLVFVNLTATPDQYRVIQQGGWTDLTPYLTGDALKEFPNLAAYPERVWRNASIRGKLYGVPRNLENGPPLLVVRQDWATKVGIPQPKTADEFFQLMTAFVRDDPDGNGQGDTFGLGATSDSAFGLDAFLQIFRAPNGWRRNPDGSLTNAVETDEFKGAVGFMRRLFAAGLYHPDAATMTQQQGRDAFNVGKIGAFQIVRTGLPQPITGFRDRLRRTNPNGDAVGLVPFGHDGGKGVTFNTPGYAGYMMIPARVGRDRERVRELLRIVDYFAAPAFSEERIFLGYGIEGVHYVRKPDGVLETNDLYRMEQGDLGNLTFGGGNALYYPHKPDEALYMQKLIADMTAIGIEDPTFGAYAPTVAMRASELRQLQIDRVGAIVQGREPLTALDTYVRDWRSRGGDQIRREYEQALREQ